MACVLGSTLTARAAEKVIIKSRIIRMDVEKFMVLDIVCQTNIRLLRF
jgi:hypothetical protein